MGKFAVFLALMFLAGPAWGYLDPPARFDHANRHVVVKWTTRDEVHRLCRNPIAIACALRQVGGKLCLIVAVHGFDSDVHLVRHEVAHCNGWPANHPL